METWRLLTTFDAEPAWNMGLDEALLEGDSPPTLRLYTWWPAALSLGWFQRVEDVPAAAHAAPLVRRISGGGAIHHARELTFAITAPRGCPLYRGSVADSYARVHGAVAHALASFGCAAELRGDTPPASDRAGTGMCFHRSTPLDLVWGGAKGVGSAQRRRGGRLLHHGSIKLGGSPLEPGIATASAAAGREVDPSELGERLVESFRERFAIRFERAELEPREVREAARREARYADPGFARRR